MKVKELKKILEDVGDDTLVLICNPQWKVTEIEGHQVVAKSPIYDGQDVLYLDIKNFKR